jgi:hypothetical protein
MERLIDAATAARYTNVKAIVTQEDILLWCKIIKRTGYLQVIWNSAEIQQTRSR